MKIVINNRSGGFGLSDEAMLRYAELAGITIYLECDHFGATFHTVPKEQRVEPLLGAWSSHSLIVRLAYNERRGKEELYDKDIARNDPFLVQVVEELGERADGPYARLIVVDVPDGVHWELVADDHGCEWIAEKHRTWG